MERKPTSSRPAFFRVLTKEDYTTSLMLPSDFVHKYGEFLVESAKLRSSCGRIWNVKIVQESRDDEKYYLKEGWNEFVKCFDLKRFDLLVLRFNIDESVFDISVFDKTSNSEREVLTPMNVYNNESHIISGESGRIKSFEAVIKYYNKFLLDIPKAFALETGIAGKREIKVENEEGKEWVVELPKIKNGRIRMVKGWSNFLIQNKMVFGSAYLFEFNAASGNLIMKNTSSGSSSSKKKGKEILSKSIIVQTTKRRGRPRKR